jgi:glycine/D-amino acid oxidase-like deaminating enzyme
MSSHLGAGLRQAERKGEAWSLRTANGESVLAKRVIFCVGGDLDHWFPKLPVQMTGGELASFLPPEDISLSYMISAAGYLAPTCNGEWVVGATHWHGQKHSEYTTEEIFARLVERAAHFLPAIREAKPRTTWFGVRAIYRPDRHPLVGAIPDLPDAYLLAAFSSKGLLLTPWCARQLASLLIHQEDTIHPTIHTRRVDPTMWQPNPSRIKSL